MSIFFDICLGVCLCRGAFGNLVAVSFLAFNFYINRNTWSRPRVARPKTTGHALEISRRDVAHLGSFFTVLMLCSGRFPF